MNKKEQLQFIEAEYPLYTNHISNRRIRHDYYVNTEVSQIISDHRRAQEVNVNESNNLPTSAEHPI